jgi:DeoR family glycerol-3-phosphate regulon repressor
MTQQTGFVTTELLAEKFGVTPQTIRRDINKLCDKGHLKRHHGGATLSSSVENLDYNTRLILNHEEKVRIAKLVAERIPNKASIFINIGTTNEEIAKALKNHEGLRVITNNLNVAQTLISNPSFEVRIAGGTVRNRDSGIIGEATLDFIRQFRVDIGIIGISGIDEDGTLLDYDYREVRVAQAIIENSREVFLATDSSKFGRSAMVRLCNLSEVDHLFTDKEPPANIMNIITENELELHLPEKH